MASDRSFGRSTKLRPNFLSGYFQHGHNLEPIPTIDEIDTEWST